MHAHEAGNGIVSKATEVRIEGYPYLNATRCLSKVPRIWVQKNKLSLKNLEIFNFSIGLSLIFD